MIKKILFIILCTTLNVNLLFSQDINAIYEDFKKDSVMFRELQNKKELSNQLLNYGYIYNTKTYKNTVKKLNLYSEIKKNESCIWVMKDSINRIKLIVAIECWEQEEWGAEIQILHFDENQNLNFYRHDRNQVYDHSLSAQNWIYQENMYPCDYFLKGNEILTKDSSCNKEEIKTEFCGNKIKVGMMEDCTDNNILDIVKAFGINGLFPPPQTYYLMQENKLNPLKKISVLSTLPNKITIKVYYSSSARCACEDFEIYDIYKNDKNEFKYEIDEDPEHTIKLNLDNDKVTSIEVAGGIGGCCSIETGQYFLKPKSNNIQTHNKQSIKTISPKTKSK
jgi:hypothetical protein